MPPERCTWCGVKVELGDGFRASEEPGERRAIFCRLEHVVPWGIQGAHWEAGSAAGASQAGEGETTCAHCGLALSDVHVVLTRHRGEHRIADRFCSADHMVEWAKAGGRWR